MLTFPARSTLETGDKTLQQTVAEPWMDPNPIVSFITTLRLPLKIDSDLLLQRVEPKSGFYPLRSLRTPRLGRCSQPLRTRFPKTRPNTLQPPSCPISERFGSTRKPGTELAPFQPYYVSLSDSRLRYTSEFGRI